MIGIDLFSGAGGLSLGAKMAGVKIRLAVEKDKAAALTYSKNHHGVVMLNDDIRKLTSIPDELNCQDEQRIIIGGPPCQGFSLSNVRTRNIDNSKNWLFEEFLRVTEIWHPDWIVLENVSGILKTADGYFWETIKKSFNELGYTLSENMLCAEDYGIPQKRNRVFLVGNLHGIEFEFPKSMKRVKRTTVADAISDLPSLENGASFDKLPYKCKAISKYARKLRGHSRYSYNNIVSYNSELILQRYECIPQGGNWKDIPPELMTNYTDRSRCHTGIYHRLSMEEPSSVIGNYRKNMLIHPLEDRGLSVREAARIQSFPDNYVFYGSIGQQQQQVGNAVPPMLAKFVFEKLLDY
jgi:DNA (cytosine-5)-methyltransferase 1